MAEFFVDDPTGSNAVLKPVLGGGEMNLKATLGNLSSTVKIVSSPRSQLTERERWLNLYLDTIEERNDTWWNDDLDLDTLSNLQEFNIGTHPRMMDTDGDGLTDAEETIASTNPLSRDTDGDGLWDLDEMLNNTNPLHSDTDRDGITDFEELQMGLDPTVENSLVSFQGSYMRMVNSMVIYI